MRTKASTHLWLFVVLLLSNTKLPRMGGSTDECTSPFGIIVSEIRYFYYWTSGLRSFLMWIVDLEFPVFWNPYWPRCIMLVLDINMWLFFTTVGSNLDMPGIPQRWITCFSTVEHCRSPSPRYKFKLCSCSDEFGQLFGCCSSSTLLSLHA